MAGELPHPLKISMALSWLLAGAPGASKYYDAPRIAGYLLELIEALPHHHDVYCYGTKAHFDAMSIRPIDVDDLKL